MAPMAAPRPQPPNMNRPPVAMPETTGRYQRCGLWVGCSPRNSPASIARSLGAKGVHLRWPTMTDTPWLGDTYSLVDAFRSGEPSPVEELEASLAAIDASQLNAFTHVDADRARAAAGAADV